MVAGYSQSRSDASPAVALEAKTRPGRPVIYASCFAAQSRLKAITVLSKVVEQAGQIGFFCGAQTFCVLGRSNGHGLQVASHTVHMAVLRCRMG
jgi:hypothetical protein